jgi:hypothetical protein
MPAGVNFAYQTTMMMTLCALVSGCPNKPEETASGGETEAGSSTGGEPASSTGGELTGSNGTTEAPTEGSASETQGGQTSATVDPGETTAETTGETTIDPSATDPSATDTSATDPGETDTGETGEGPVEECTKACQHLAECAPNNPGDVETCAAECADAYSGDAVCVAAGAAFATCLAEMTCEQLVAFLEQEDPGPCEEEFLATGEACGGNECVMNAGGGEGDQCSVGRQCGDLPAQDFVCEGPTCACIEGGMKVGSCPSEGVCMKDVDAQVAAAQTCCGWDWS